MKNTNHSHKTHVGESFEKDTIKNLHDAQLARIHFLELAILSIFLSS
jgi:hypothetical protein